VTASPFELARDARRVEARSEQMLLSDPALAEFLGMNQGSLAGVSVTPETMMGLSAFFRGVSILAGTVAGLPLNTYTKNDKGDRAKVSSILDAPHADLTQFEWVELLMCHLIMWGNAYHAPVYTNGGELKYLNPVDPGSVRPVRAGINGLPRNEWGKWLRVTDLYGTQHYLDPTQLLQVKGLGFNDLEGFSLVTIARQSFGTAIAADQAAGRQFGTGLMLGGMLSAAGDADITEDEATDIKRSFKQRAQGIQNAGDIAFIPANVTFTPWTMNNEDAQFLESRHFSIEEQARWLGLPKFLLAEDGASTWGAGLKEMNNGLARYCLRLFTNRIEQRLSRVVGRPTNTNKYVEFNYADLLQPVPEENIPLIIQQVEAKLLLPNEARRMMNLPPLPGGDEFPKPPPVISPIVPPPAGEDAPPANQAPVPPAAVPTKQGE
jgi:HK97 family phage portal protein